VNKAQKTRRGLHKDFTKQAWRDHLDRKWKDSAFATNG
jgi:hypothetical protein